MSWLLKYCICIDAIEIDTLPTQSSWRYHGARTSTNVDVASTKFDEGCGVTSLPSISNVYDSISFDRT